MQHLFKSCKRNFKLVLSVIALTGLYLAGCRSTHKKDDRLVWLLLWYWMQSQSCPIQPTSAGVHESSLPGAASGAVYHVDTGGDDSNDGSSSFPFRTLQHAIDRAVPGDSVVVHAGSYTDSLNNNGVMYIQSKSAEQSKPIVISVNLGDTVTVNSFIVKDSRYLILDGFTITGTRSLPSGWSDMPTVIRSGTYNPIDSSEDWESIRRQKVWTEFPGWMDYARSSYDSTGIVDAGILLQHSDHVILKNMTIEYHSAGIQMENETTETLVENNTIRFCFNAIRGRRNSGYYYSYASSTIRNNTTRQILQESIRANDGAIAILISGNDVQYSGHSHITTYNSPLYQFPCAGQVEVRSNSLAYGGYYSETMEYPGSSGISLHTCGAGCEASGNWIAYQYDASGNDGNGIIVDYNKGNGALIYNNVIYRVYGSGIQLTESGNATIFQNTVVQAGYKEDGTTATTFARNGMALRLSGSGSSGTANRIANNIFYRYANGGLFLDGVAFSSQEYLDYNLLYSPSKPVAGVRDVNGSVTYYSTVSDFQAGVSSVASTISSDPLFTNESLGDFTLDVSSPARNAGTSLYSTSTDRNGNSRDPDHPGVGAYE